MATTSSSTNIKQTVSRRDWAEYFKAYPEAKTALKSVRKADVVILHINDVYELLPVNNGTQGGMVNVASLAKLFADKDPVIAFGGDAFSSGMFSTLTKGKDMVGAFNLLGVDVAVIGNHEFDAGFENANQRFSESEFTWLNTNILGPDGSSISEHLKQYQVLTVNGHRIGFLGLVSDWETEGSLKKGTLGTHIYHDDVQTADTEALALQQRDQTELEVALCHGNHDEEIVAQTAIDVVLGGHDHEPINRRVGSDLVMRAGSDLENMSVVTVKFNDNDAPQIQGFNLPVDPNLIPDDSEMSAYVNSYEAGWKVYRRQLATTGVDLDGRKENVRQQGTNLGNLVADSVRNYFGADVALINGGGLRSEQIHAKGPITVFDTMNILSFPNSLVSLEITGAQLREALENGLGALPNASGGFPQISGMTVRFDSARPVGQRVLDIVVNGESITADGIYRVATISFLADGGNGYDVFKEAQSRVNDNSEKVIGEIFADYLENLIFVAPTINEQRLVDEKK